MYYSYYKYSSLNDKLLQCVTCLVVTRPQHAPRPTTVEESGSAAAESSEGQPAQEGAASADQMQPSVIFI